MTDSDDLSDAMRIHLAAFGIRNDNRRDALIALRDYITIQMAHADPGPAAALAGRMSEVLREIASIPNEKAVSTLDEIAGRRAARLANGVESDTAVPGGGTVRDNGGS